MDCVVSLRNLVDSMLPSHSRNIPECSTKQQTNQLDKIYLDFMSERWSQNGGQTYHANKQSFIKQYTLRKNTDDLVILLILFVDKQTRTQ